MYLRLYELCSTPINNQPVLAPHRHYTMDYADYADYADYIIYWRRIPRDNDDKDELEQLTASSSCTWQADATGTACFPIFPAGTLRPAGTRVTFCTLGPAGSGFPHGSRGTGTTGFSGVSGAAAGA